MLALDDKETEPGMLLLVFWFEPPPPPVCLEVLVDKGVPVGSKWDYV